MIEKVTIRDIQILAVKNETEFVHFLMNKEHIKTGKLIAINAEKIIISENQPEIKNLLKQSEYNYADGISIVFSIRKKYRKYKTNRLERIAGIDLWLSLMKQSAIFDIPVFLVGGQKDTVSEVKNKLSQWNVNIVGIQDGYFDLDKEQEIINQIKKSKAKFITVAMGSPKQEEFMFRAQQQYPEALYMGVGGTYDVYTGKVKRAPKNWQKLNLEWLYRLLNQPNRWRRQFNLVRYFYYYLTNKL